ncbi:glycosyltransferase [Bacillus sp. FJAT-47783]|uniref:glycosyltransferase n=1 Tax=Bacillus sp. FJAT-47783 TaxID=2922712 RepID=UPI001FAB977C|nr:glycosyltransferase [Bacillus sp. FJAT-47783]
MCQVLCISDSYPIHPRLQKLGELFSPNNQVHYILWNRSGQVGSKNNTYIYNSSTGYGKKLKKIKDLPKFNLFILKVIRNLKPDVIICRHWQIYLMVSMLNIKKVKVIYDVCDMPSNRFVRLVEKVYLKKAHKVVLASRFFSEFYEHEDILILENRPELKNCSIKKSEIKAPDSTKLRITFLGKIRYLNIMKNLIGALKNSEKYEIKFYGDGPDYKTLKRYCDEHYVNNVNFYGRYNSNDIAKIYNDTDIVWCAYPNHNFNVKYAISNKFFETLAFKKPGVFSINTRISELVKNKDIGFLVDPYSEEDIKSLFNKISLNPKILNDVINRINKCGEPVFWDDYKDQKEKYL